MGISAGKSLTVDQVRKLLEQLELAATREACWSCECLQGFITQLELEADKEGKQLLEMYKVMPERLHGCLGCEPCRPSEAFATYTKAR